MDDETAEAFKLYSEQISNWPGNGIALDEQLGSFHESYRGYFGRSMMDAKLKYAYQYVEETGMLANAPTVFERFDMRALQGICFKKGIVR